MPIFPPAPPNWQHTYNPQTPANPKNVQPRDPRQIALNSPAGLAIASDARGRPVVKPIGARTNFKPSGRPGGRGAAPAPWTGRGGPSTPAATPVSYTSNAPAPGFNPVGQVPGVP